MSINSLNDISTSAPKNFYLDKEEAKKKVDKLAEKISEKLTILNAQKKYSILVIFQGMDGSGKDGVTKQVFGATHPSITSTIAFKKPTEEEIVKIVKEWTIIAAITQEEDADLRKEKLSKTMPKNWNGCDLFARYRKVGIQVPK